MDVYFTVFYISLIFYLLDIVERWGDAEPGPIDVLTAMTILYMLIVNASTLPVNLAIIIKEISMEFFQFLNNHAGFGSDDVSLGYN